MGIMQKLRVKGTKYVGGPTMQLTCLDPDSKGFNSKLASAIQRITFEAHKKA